MQLTLSDMKRKVKSILSIQQKMRVPRVGTNDYINWDLEIIDMLNDAYNYYANLCRERDWFVKQAPLYTLTANQSIYLFPSDWLSVKRFDRVDVNPPVPVYRIKDQQVGFFPLTYPNLGFYPMSWEFSGVSNVNGVINQQFSIIPVPTITLTSSLRLLYDRILTPLANDTDVPELPLNFHELIPTRVLHSLGMLYTDMEFKLLEMQLYSYLANTNRQSSDFITTETDYGQSD